MAANRRTYRQDPDTSQGTANPGFEKRQRKLGEELGGVIFICNRDTLAECKNGLIFGLPKAHWCCVQYIRVGIPLFLYNVSDKTLHGIYRATTPGSWELNPSGWTRSPSQKTQFPSQVSVELFLDCPPLSERDFRSALTTNYYRERNRDQFLQELDKQQATELCNLFHRQSNKSVPRVWPPEAILEVGEYLDEGVSIQQYLSQKQQARAAAIAGSNSASTAATNGGSSHQAEQKQKTFAALQEEEARRAQKAATMKRSVEGTVVGQSRPTEAQEQQPTSRAGPSSSAGAAVAVAAVPSTSTPTIKPTSKPEDKPGVDDLSDELTALKTTLAPLLQKTATASVNGNSQLGPALRAHMEHMDDHLMKIQKERVVLMRKAESAAASASASGTQTGPIVSTDYTPVPTYDEDLYVIGGGLNAHSWSNLVEIYSTKTKSWRLGPSMPTPRGYFGQTVVNNHHIYVVGGGTGDNNQPSAVAELTTMRLDIRTGFWSEVAPLKKPRMSLGCVSLSGRVFAIGGGHQLKTIEWFDPGLNVWVQGPSMQQARFGLAAATIGSAIYVCGGYSETAYVASAEMWDPREGKWHLLPPMPEPRATHSACAFHDNLFVTGGCIMQPATIYNSVVSFDIKAGRWHKEAPMALPRAYGATALLEGRPVVLGGMSGLQTSQEVIEFNTSFEGYGVHITGWDRGNERWKVSQGWSGVAAMRTPRAFLGATVISK